MNDKITFSNLSKDQFDKIFGILEKCWIFGRRYEEKPFLELESVGSVDCKSGVEYNDVAISKPRYTEIYSNQYLTDFRTANAKLKFRPENCPSVKREIEGCAIYNMILAIKIKQSSGEEIQWHETNYYPSWNNDDFIETILNQRNNAAKKAIHSITDIALENN